MSMKNFSSGERLFATDLNGNFTETTKAGNVTSGTFNAARIPGLDASKITTGKIAQARLPIRKVARFTGNGTWTAPTGVTYAIAHMLGGGGGVGDGTSAGNGADSTVAFPAGTFFSRGGRKGSSNVSAGATAAAANSGQPATFNGGNSFTNHPGGASASIFLTGGSNVTPGSGYSVVVGAGGAAGTNGAAGGSGYVWIEYYE
jgi:hypothetical protein